MEAVKPLVKAILSRYPDYGKAAPEYKLAMLEYFAGLSKDEREFLADRNVGLSAHSEFLPTDALCKKLLDARRAKWGVLPDYSHIARGADGKPLVDDTPRTSQPPAYVQDRRGDRRLWRPEDDTKFASMREATSKAERMQAYALHLGKGNLERGWQIIMDTATFEPPADFQPQEGTA